MISVIMPVYNNEKYVSLAIQSVMDQTFKDWELIIINDASNDNSRSIIENKIEGNSKIRLINLKENKGVSFARNIGIKKSKGEYISFLDSDDLWNENFLELMYKKIKLTQKRFIYTGFIYLYDNGKIKYSDIKLSGGDINRHIVFRKNRYELLLPFNMDSVLIEKNLLEENDIFFSEDQTLFEDGLFFSKILCLTESAGLKENLTYYRQHVNSAIHRKYSASDYLQELTFLNRLKTFITKYNTVQVPLLDEVIIYRTYRVILCMIKEGYLNEALVTLKLYKYNMIKFLSRGYFRSTDKLKCKLLLSEEKIVFYIIKYLSKGK